MRGKQIYFVLAIACLIQHGCSERDEDNLSFEDGRSAFLKPVDPKTEVSRFSRELQIEGENLDGELPALTNIDPSFVQGFTATASITKDNILFLPISYQSENDVVEALLQLENANNYWQIPVQTVNNGTNLQLGIPSHVLNGEFLINYILRKNNGETSQVLRTMVDVVSAESECNGSSFPTIEGNDGLTVKTYILPDIGTGTLTVTYNTFTIPDRLDIRYNKEWVASTGDLLTEGEAPPVKDCNDVTSGDGFIGAFNRFTIEFNTQVSRELDIYVSGCLNNGTRWTVTVSCPNNGNQDALWYEKLPACPCTFEEVENGQLTETPAGEWRVCTSASQAFHYGATSEIRWIPISSESADESGQQCTYDANGNLITSGIAAGSPDLVSPGGCGFDEFLGIDPNEIGADYLCFTNHCIFDVQPWQANTNRTLPCTNYLKLWPSNQGDCATNTRPNPVNDITHLATLIGNISCEEVTTLFEIRDLGAPLVPQELFMYLSDSGAPKPSNLLDLLTTLRNNLGCDLISITPQCRVVDRLILNLTS